MANRWISALCLCLLAACGRNGGDSAPSQDGYRDRTVPISSKALFDPALFMGTWHEVARFPNPFESGCTNASFDFAAGQGAQIAVRHSCLGTDGTVQRTLDGAATPSGPGRMAVNFGPAAFPAGEFWVLWTDETYRTAVIGTPDGRAGWILNRQPVIPSDRLNAAREILDFNGYDLNRLVVAGGQG